MRITEFAEIIGQSLTLTHHGSRERPWKASLGHDVEVMERGMLGGQSGHGETPEAAIADLVTRLKGKRIAVGAYTDQRREYQIPSTLEP